MRLAIANAPRAQNKFDADQRKFIARELEMFVNGNEGRRSSYIDDDRLISRAPNFVRSAQRVVDRYIKRARKELNEPRIAREKIAVRVEEEILFGDPRKALAMLRKAKRNG